MPFTQPVMARVTLPTFVLPGYVAANPWYIGAQPFASKMIPVVPLMADELARSERLTGW
jgi:hypothetical protein